MLYNRNSEKFPPKQERLHVCQIIFLLLKLKFFGCRTTLNIYN